MRTRTTEYGFTYGRRPRGLGNWIFDICRSDGTVAETFWTLGVYSKAVRRARARARDVVGRHGTIVVCP